MKAVYDSVALVFIIISFQTRSIAIHTTKVYRLGRIRIPEPTVYGLHLDRASRATDENRDNIGAIRITSEPFIAWVMNRRIFMESLSKPLQKK